MQHKTSNIIIAVIIIIILIAGFVFWFLFMHSTTNNGSSTNNPSTGFNPFGQTGTNQQGTSTNNTPGNNVPTEVTIPSLRLLSSTPIGGYGASTTASTTFVRWIDRGRGNILEAREDSINITTLSNTLLPRTYESTWNKDLTSFMGSILGDDDQTVTTLFASLSAQSTSTSSSAPYNLQGKNLPDGIVAYASSPKKDRIFLYVVQNGQGIGYTAPFSGGTATQIFTTPVTQVNVEWPEDNTIAITTAGSADASGYLYFINPKTGTWKKVLGPIAGLSTRVSHDAKYVLVSASDKADGVLTGIYSVASSTSNDAIIRTLADKCVWGNFYKEMVYCAVPFQPVSGTYPDDWYKGTLSTIDKIWQVNAQTGEVHLVSSVFIDAKRSIDAFNLGLDNKDNYLFFMNKNDLSFWSLDLVTAQGK